MLRIYKILPFIILLLFGFTTPVNPPTGNWYQQFMPNLNGRQISDITFTDSLNGFAITNSLSITDTSFVFKTSNGGDNWFFTHSDSGVIYSRIRFIDQNTGFIGGYIHRNGLYWIVKTTDKGSNWYYINAPYDFIISDMSVLNEDTIWVAGNNGFHSAVMWTTNRGTNWQEQLIWGDLGSGYIYMFNTRFGFASCVYGTQLYRTMNGGNNWSFINGTDGFSDMKFMDTLTGWKASGFMRKTTNGGLNWVQQTIPYGGIIAGTALNKFSVINQDTIFGVGSTVEYPNLQVRGIIYRTTNGGQNWLFQVPDTAIQIRTYYSYIQFLSNPIGWAYLFGQGGIHTTAGGDPGWIADVKQISNIIPKQCILYQNYPNPFNPSSKFKVQISKLSNVQIKVFDITGRSIKILVNQNLNIGEYEITIDGSNLSSGVYFYNLIVDGKLIDTKKFIMIK